jgi:hypothetical protein
LSHFSEIIYRPFTHTNTIKKERTTLIPPIFSLETKLDADRLPGGSGQLLPFTHGFHLSEDFIINFSNIDIVYQYSNITLGLKRWHKP